MGFQVSQDDGVTLVEVEGQLIVGNRQELKQKVLEHLEDGDGSSSSTSPRPGTSTPPGWGCW